MFRSTNRCTNWPLCLYSGRTEYQTATINRARRSVKFERKPSHRYSRRPTFERAEREERLRRDQDRGDRKRAAADARYTCGRVHS